MRGWTLLDTSSIMTGRKVECLGTQADGLGKLKARRGSGTCLIISIFLYEVRGEVIS